MKVFALNRIPQPYSQPLWRVLVQPGTINRAKFAYIKSERRIFTAYGGAQPTKITNPAPATIKTLPLSSFGAAVVLP